MSSQKIYRIIGGTALILLIPLVATLFVKDFDWNWFDFVVACGLLIGTGLMFEFAAAKLDPWYRMVTAVVLLAALFLAWAELSVGIFGSPFAGS